MLNRTLPMLTVAIPLASIAVLIAAAIPGATCHVVASAGHAVMLEAPDPVNHALHSHLSNA